MIALSLACFIALLLSPLGLAQKPDPLAKITGKTIQYEYNADFGLMDDLPVIPGRLEPSPLAAQTCQFPEGLEDFGCSSGVQMFVITLEDCATPWTLCYCPLSEATPEQALAAFGRVPIGLRRNVEVFHLYPSSAKIPDSGLGFYMYAITECRQIDSNRPLVCQIERYLYCRPSWKARQIARLAP